MAKTIARKAYDQALAFAYINDEYRRKPFTLAHVGDDATILMPAAFCNIAFACELFMKAVLFTTEEHGDSTSIRDHSLERLFFMLPSNLQARIKNEIVVSDANPASFDERLSNSANSFERFRYAYEHDTLSMDIIFLSAFECVLWRVARELIVDSVK